MSKHIKTTEPTDADLKGDIVIGASKGVTMAQASTEDVEDILGENTVEGDMENDTNRFGGIDKAQARSGR